MNGRVDHGGWRAGRGVGKGRCGELEMEVGLGAGAGAGSWIGCREEAREKCAVGRQGRLG